MAGGKFQPVSKVNACQSSFEVEQKRTQNNLTTNNDAIDPIVESMKQLQDHNQMLVRPRSSNPVTQYNLEIKKLLQKQSTLKMKLERRGRVLQSMRSSSRHSGRRESGEITFRPLKTLLQKASKLQSKMKNMASDLQGVKIKSDKEALYDQFSHQRVMLSRKFQSKNQDIIALETPQLVYSS